MEIFRSTVTLDKHSAIHTDLHSAFYNPLYSLAPSQFGPFLVHNLEVYNRTGG